MRRKLAPAGTGDVSRDLVAALTQSGTFKLVGTYQSIEALSNDIRKSTIDAGVVIPADFARDLDRGRPTTVQVLLNAMVMVTLTEASIKNYLAERIVESPQTIVEMRPSQLLQTGSQQQQPQQQPRFENQNQSSVPSNTNRSSSAAKPSSTPANANR